MKRPAFSPNIIEPAPTTETTLEDAKGTMCRMVQRLGHYIDELEVSGKINSNAKAAHNDLASKAADLVEEFWTE